MPCALPKDGFEYREGREKPLDPDLADVSSKKTTTRQRERERERERVTVRSAVQLPLGAKK